MILNYIDEDNKISEELRHIFEKASELALEDEIRDIKPSEIEISLTIVSKGEIREINNEYRGIDKPTDVLSFPQYQNIKEIKEEVDKNPEIIMLGDVVICDEIAEVQAREYGNKIEREFVYLFVHSLFHLMGYDHMLDDERRIMRKKEEDVMRKIGLER